MTKTRKAPSLTGLITSLALMATPLVTSAEQNTIETPEPVHGIAMHGDVKYPENFSHFDYANPQAPKRGQLHLGVVSNGFCSCNPYGVRGVAAAGINTYVYVTLRVPSDEEPLSEYGLIAESVVIPDNRSYVIFNLRQQARFQEGEPIT